MDERVLGALESSNMSCNDDINITTDDFTDENNDECIGYVFYLYDTPIEDLVDYLNEIPCIRDHITKFLGGGVDNEIKYTWFRMSDAAPWWIAELTRGLHTKGYAISNDDYMIPNTTSSRDVICWAENGKMYQGYETQWLTEGYLAPPDKDGTRIIDFALLDYPLAGMFFHLKICSEHLLQEWISIINTYHV